ncbi:MAG: hypothetical protein ACLTBV_11815 [Enterocloster bolteae]
MAVVGLRYGYDVVTSLMGSGLALAVSAIFVEAVAVLVSFIIGHKLFGLNWIILSGAIAGGCNISTRAWGCNQFYWFRRSDYRLWSSTAICNFSECSAGNDFFNIML